MFLVSVNQELYLSSMQIKQNKLFLEALLHLGNGNKFSNLVKGNSSNFYVIDTNYGSNIRVRHIQILTDYSMIQITSKEFGVIPDNQQTTHEQLLASPTDSESDVVAYSVLEQGDKGVIRIESNIMTFLPEMNQNGEDSTKLLVSDIHGNSTEFNINYSITPVNDAPELDIAKFEVAEDTVLNSVFKITEVENHIHEFTLKDSSHLKGEIKIEKNGVFEFTPNKNFNGDTSFELRLTDEIGDTFDYEINIVVTPVDDLPFVVTVLETVAYESNVKGKFATTYIDGDVLEYLIF
ncbi:MULTISPECIES: Ig-like domain-containing protein [unclassified Pseudoalteromonas]|uniref:Ig-like domain-containing protein n=1 Tax=unclassified Pseudoalteromonas TaxID=194690 RepID=UPI0005A9EA1E|nr:MULTISPECIES: Ig-like domain-containing protein [unclassified Pseudoalteromonas]